LVMKSSDIGRLRLVNQQIVGSKFKTPDEIVRWMGAMQAQDYLGGLWAVGLRLPHPTEADIEQAIVERKIIRTWPMRGTLHFVAAEDARWMLTLMTPRIVAGAKKRREQLDIDDVLLGQSEEVFARVLQGGTQLTRKQMMAVLEQAGISTANQRGYHLLWYAAQKGLICFGPRKGKEHTFVLLDEWVLQSKRMEREEALAEIAKRYFISHGPAQIMDFVWWTGLTVADAKAAIEMSKLHLVSKIVDGKIYWMSPTLPTSKHEAETVSFLPPFDEYLLGYRDRSAVLNLEHAQKVVPGANGMFMPTIVVNEQVVGIWKRVIKKDKVIITPSFFEKVAGEEKHILSQAAQRYGEFLGLPVE
jgi:hypothetical protein